VSVGTVYQKLIRRRLRRQGFESRYVDLSGYNLHSLDGQFNGELGTLVFVHGLGSSALSLSPLLKRLAPHFSRVVAIDLLGHGENESPAQTVAVETVYELFAEQLQRVGGGPFALYGSSLGGGFSLRFAIEHPECVSRLALTSPAGAPLRKIDIKRLRALFTVDSPEEMRSLVNALFHRPPWYGSLLGRELKLAMERPIVKQILAQLESIQTLTAQDVEQLSIPVLLIWGQSESLLPRHCLDWFRAHLPRQTYIEQPFGYGHSPHLEAADDLSARLLHFLRK
jgi:pimeloyl-ACP methyl ester carboxylesterase